MATEFQTRKIEQHCPECKGKEAIQVLCYEDGRLVSDVSHCTNERCGRTLWSWSEKKTKGQMNLF